MRLSTTHCDGSVGSYQTLGGKGPSGGKSNQSDLVLLKNPARSIDNRRNDMRLDGYPSMVFAQERVWGAAI